MVPQNYITLTGEGDVKNMEKLIDMLEDNDDVQTSGTTGTTTEHRFADRRTGRPVLFRLLQK